MRRRTLLLAATLLSAPSAVLAQTPAAQQAVTVDDIVVTASTREQRVVDAPASISIVTAETLANRPSADLTDALRDVEGVSVSGGSNFQDILMRGLPGAYTLILVDGKRQSTRDARVNGNGGVEQSFVPPVGAIERIEVVRGPMSSLYGSDALGGVVNIITRKVPDRWGGAINADYIAQDHSKSGDWNQAQAYLAGPIIPGVLGAQIWGRAYDRTEDTIFNAPNSAGVSGSDEHSLTGRLAWTPSDAHEVLLQYDTMKVRRDSTAGRTLAANARSTRNDNQRDAWSLSWNGDWSWGTSALSVLREEGQREQYTANATGVLIRNARAPQIANTVYDALFNIPLGSHTVAVGGQYVQNELTDFNPGARDNVDAQFEVWQRALFVEDEWAITPDFALTLGLRVDDHKRYGAHWSPRVYAVWNATEALTIKGGVSTGFRAPEVRAVADGYAYETGGANCNYGAGLCGVIIGDPDLKPETSTNYEVSALWNPSRSLLLSATVFRTDFEDRIDSDRVCGPDVNSNGRCDVPGEVLRWSEDPLYQLYYWYNLQNAQIQGVELSGRWAATDRISFKANYTYTDSEQQGGTYDGLPLARTPEHMASARVDFDVTEALNLWGAVSYHGEEINAQLRSGVNGTPVGIGAARRYPDYTTVDIGGAWRVNDSLRLKVGVYNLTDKVLDVRTYDFQGDGRRGWFGFSYEF